MRLNLDQYQAKQARQSHVTAQDTLQRMIAEVYKWLISPMQTASSGKISDIEWEPFPLNTAAQSIPKTIDQVLRDNELLISEWSPIHLHNLLKQWFWKPDHDEILAREVWQHMCRQLYLPRLKSESVFTAALQAGSTRRDFFGLAQGKEAGRYLGFTFGVATMPFTDSGMLLINPEAASAWQAVLNEEHRKRDEAAGQTQVGQPAPVFGAYSPSSVLPGEAARPSPALRQTRFYATVDIAPHGAKMRFGDIVDNIVHHLAERTDTKVTISIEIQAENINGFQEDIQRVLKENANTLKFKSTAFEE